MPKRAEDVCQLQYLAQMSFPKRILNWGERFFKKSLLKTFRVRKKAKMFQNENMHTALTLG